jgi:hypothetical protein
MASTWCFFPRRHSGRSRLSRGDRLEDALRRAGHWCAAHERLDQRLIPARLQQRPPGGIISLRPSRRCKGIGMRATRVCPSDRIPSEIAGHRHIDTIAPGQLARPCTPSPPRGASQGRAARRGIACGGDRSELFGGRVVLTLLGAPGFSPAGPAPVAAAGRGGQSWR